MCATSEETKYMSHFIALAPQIRYTIQTPNKFMRARVTQQYMHPVKLKKDQCPQNMLANHAHSKNRTK